MASSRIGIAMVVWGLVTAVRQTYGGGKLPCRRQHALILLDRQPPVGFGVLPLTITTYNVEPFSQRARSRSIRQIIAPVISNFSHYHRYI